MANQIQATVEALTAEVRVLMVGNRQVTLSVARQLDTVPLAEMEPFGRVRLRAETTAVIGRHRSTGALVTAFHGREGAYLATMSSDGRITYASFDAEIAGLPLIVLAGLK